MNEYRAAPVKIRPDVRAVPAYTQGAVPQDLGFKLSSNENPFPPLAAVEAAIARVPVHRYAAPGMDALRGVIGAQFGLDPMTASRRVHLGAGSVSILYQLLQSVAGPGDEYLYAWPSFEGYPLLGLASGAVGIRVPLGAASEHDLDRFAELVTERTRAILLCSPNNPTGPVIARADFTRFMDRIPNDVLVVLDEAYREFVTDPEAVRGEDVLPAHPNLVVLRTYSKAYGLASLRIGYGVGDEEIWAAARTVGIPLSVTGQAEAAALAVHDPAVREEVRGRIDALIDRRERLSEGLRALGLAVPAAQGNFVWLPVGDFSELLGAAFEQAGIRVRVFPDTGVRVSVGEDESVVPVIDVTTAFLEQHPGALRTPGATVTEESD